MERSGNKKQKVGFKTVQARLDPDHYEKLKEAPGKTCSEKIRALIDAEHYLYLKENSKILGLKKCPPPTINWEIENLGYFYSEGGHRINYRQRSIHMSCEHRSKICKYVVDTGVCCRHGSIL